MGGASPLSKAKLDSVLWLQHHPLPSHSATGLAVSSAMAACPAPTCARKVSLAGLLSVVSPHLYTSGSFVSGLNITSSPSSKLSASSLGTSEAHS